MVSGWGTGCSGRKVEINGLTNAAITSKMITDVDPTTRRYAHVGNPDFFFHFEGRLRDPVFDFTPLLVFPEVRELSPHKSSVDSEPSSRIPSAFSRAKSRFSRAQVVY